MLMCWQFLTSRSNLEARHMKLLTGLSGPMGPRTVLREYPESSASKSVVSTFRSRRTLTSGWGRKGPWRCPSHKRVCAGVSWARPASSHELLVHFSLSLSVCVCVCLGACDCEAFGGGLSGHVVVCLVSLGVVLCRVSLPLSLSLSMCLRVSRLAPASLSLALSPSEAACASVV